MDHRAAGTVHTRQELVGPGERSIPAPRVLDDHLERDLTVATSRPYDAQSSHGQHIPKSPLKVLADGRSVNDFRSKHEGHQAYA
jgi:hypothetical protein